MVQAGRAHKTIRERAMNDDATPPAHDKVQLDSRDVAYQGFFRLARYTLRHATFSGGWSETLTREVFERGHAVAVLPYDPERERIVFIDQFRPGAYAAGMEPWLTEIPAGIAHEGESKAEVARRETSEETGCTVYELEPIQRYLVSPGGTSESVELYCGRVDTRNVGGLHGLASENEDIRVFTLPAGEAKRRVLEGEISNAATLIALQWFALNHDRLYKTWAKAHAASES